MDLALNGLIKKKRKRFFIGNQLIVGEPNGEKKVKYLKKEISKWKEVKTPMEQKVQQNLL